MSRLDRIYVTLPAWTVPLIALSADPARSPAVVHAARISDHSPVIVRVAPRSALPKSRRAIPPQIFELDHYRVAHDALAAAAQPHDRVVALAENAPGFLEALAAHNLDLPDGQAGGSGTAPNAKDTRSPPADDDSSPADDDDDESPLESDSNAEDDPADDDELLQDEEFRKQVEALQLKNLTEK